MNIPILDCHQHLIAPERFPYSWTAGISALAGKAFGYEEYLRELAGQAEVRTIFMETAPDDPHWHEESRWAQELSDAPDTIIDGLVLNCRPESEPDFDRFIASVRHPRLVGFRRILHVVPDHVSQEPLFVQNVQKLEKYGLTFDLCLLERQLPLGLELARHCPGVQFVLDHCGVPEIAGGKLDPWRTHIRDLAACSNVACKISGLLAYCPPDRANIDTVRPYVEHCIESFGWDRVVWGSDWPVVRINGDLPGWIGISRELVAGESPAHQHQLFHRNAERIYLKRGTGPCPFR